MKFRKRKVFFLMVAVIIAAGIFAQPVNAEWTEEDFDIEMVDGRGTITYFRASPEEMEGYGRLDIVIPSTIAGYPVLAIGDYVFSDRRMLYSVVIPDSVKSIGNGAFCDCYNLETVKMTDSVTSIGRSAFANCYMMDYITLSENLESIGNSAFNNCSGLRELFIPDSVTYIGDYAFYDCTMTDIYYSGTEEQWNAISIGKENEGLERATIHYNHIHEYLVYVNKPSCYQDGDTLYRCVCGKKYTEILPAGHSYVEYEAKAPTCKEVGWSAYRACENCRYTTYVEKAALGHDFSGTVTVVEPTCTTQGYTEVLCTRCQEVSITDQVTAFGHDYTADPTTCGTCGHVRVALEITTVTLRPSCAGMYFGGAFTFDNEVAVARYGIVASLYNPLPVADDSDEESIYTIGTKSALITGVLTTGDGKVNAKKPVYTRAYALLEDGTIIYGNVVTVSMKSLVEAVDSKAYAGLNAVQKNALDDMYRQFATVMANWNIPNIKENGSV